MRVHLNQQEIDYSIRGRRQYGRDEVLLDLDDNLIAGTPWSKKGYGVAPFLKGEDARRFREGIEEIFRSLLMKEGIRDLSGFRLEKYHRTVQGLPDVHARVVDQIRGCFPTSGFPIPVRRVVDRISQVCGVGLTVRNPVTGMEVFCLRVVRPQCRDFNPPHRDVWLDRLRNAINIYAPIAGSNEKSSLSLVPGSHLWKESEIERTREGAVVGKLAYTVPAVTSAKKRIRMVRPNPGPDEVLVFSPYLIHGGAANLNKDVTRVSLEMRFWRVV